MDHAVNKGSGGADRLTVLFTGAGRRVELLRAFRAARTALGLEGKVVATDLDTLAPALYAADAYELVPPSAAAGYVRTLLGICRAHEVDLIFPLIDNDIPVLAEAADLFAEVGARVAAMGPESAKTVSDKWATAQLLRETGVEGPQTWLPAGLPPRDSLEFPLYIKPRYGSGSKHTARVDTLDELDVFMGRVPEPVIQEFLEGPEITCDLAYSLDGEFLGMCQRRRIEVRTGEVQKGVTVWDADIARSCLAIGAALGARGPITVQCLFRHGRPHFTEVNGRFGGGLPLAIAAGLDFPRWYLALAAGLPVDLPAPGSYRQGLYLTRCDESFFCTGLEGDDGRYARAGEHIFVERGPWLSPS
jgi:carbamoyl-phosphate synthase large subunit